jgi:electron transfer flavoprotein alpha subunit
LGAAVFTGCSFVSVEAPGRLTLRRPVFGGLAAATLSACGCPAVASILGDALGPGGEEPARTPGTVEQVPALGTEERQRSMERRRLPPRDIPLAQADVVVAGGLGLGGPDAVPLLEELADALGGTIGATRPVVDRGWLPPDRQIGQSGALIAPRVYVACGISGAPQHLAGVRRAKTVIAINIDPGAPIMKLADVPIVGDVRLVLPELIRAVRQARGARAVAAASEEGR